MSSIVPRTALLAKLMQSIGEDERFDMTEGVTDATSLLRPAARRTQIEHFWVTYHDYSGVGAAKSDSSRRHSAPSMESGWSLPLRIWIWTSSIASRRPRPGSADSGDFLAVPDPAQLHRAAALSAKTAIANGWMRATDGSVWHGCPRTRSGDRSIEDAGSERLLVQCGARARVLFAHMRRRWRIRADQRRPHVHRGRSARRAAVFARCVDELRAMGVTVGQLGKEYGPGQYEMSVHHGTPIEAVDVTGRSRTRCEICAREWATSRRSCPRSILTGPATVFTSISASGTVDGENDLTPRPTMTPRSLRNGLGFSADCWPMRRR